jgi:hypothetical protein
VVTITQPTSPVHTLAQMQREGDMAMGCAAKSWAPGWRLHAAAAEREGPNLSYSVQPLQLTANGFIFE